LVSESFGFSSRTPGTPVSKDIEKVKFLSHGKFAKVIGLSQPRVTRHVNRAIKEQSPFIACLNNRKQINPEHPEARAYIRDVKARKEEAATAEATIERFTGYAKDVDPQEFGPELDTLAELEDTANTGPKGNAKAQTVRKLETNKLENITLKQIVERHGGLPGFKAYVDALNSIASIKGKTIKYDRDARILVERKAVEMTVFSLLDLAFSRIVGEMPNAVTARIVPTVMSEGSGAHATVIGILEKECEKILKNCKQEVIQRFKRLEEV
jgi:hypothetical protein